MPWLKLDDQMGEHRKTRRLLRAAGTSAFGLHALALLHCARYLTDGFVEAEFVEEVLDAAHVLDETERGGLVDALVAGGQWTPRDGGWQIHDYLEHNPSRADVEERRARDAQRKAAGRRNGAHTTSVRAESAGSPNGHDAEDARPPKAVPADNGRPPVKYDGKPVPAATLEVAVEILAAFNEQAGTTYKPFTAVDKPSESLRRILGSVLRLKLTPDRGRAMIAHQLADPYWQGPAATGNVFGPGVDERNHQATAPGAAPVSSVEFVERLNAGQARLQRDIPAPSQDAA